MGFSQTSSRQDISLNDNWLVLASDTGRLSYPLPIIDPALDNLFEKVNVPDNRDGYEGYRRLLHGNRHGDAWYRKTFSVRQSKKQKRFFLFFEGVGSYATVFLNGRLVGKHAGGRTTFTIDITDVVQTDGSNNSLEVRADHPANIKDLPWVCGGCSDERGFSEGSQPMGIFRPVHLVITNDLRIEPFGVHAWADITGKEALLNISTTIKNYSQQNKSIVIVHRLIDAKGKVVAEITSPQSAKAKDSFTVSQKIIRVVDPLLWSAQNPYLYKIVSIIKEGNRVIDQLETPFGFRTINWRNSTNQFFLNGVPVFINGVAEYEHILGQSHAFSNEQIRSRMNWVKAAGFNAFRDGHQPHNLLYGQLCDSMGILWWTQLSAHIWYDTPEFRKNFKQLLREWVIERRNDPSVVLWGLQNESKLPEDFAKECTELIRSLDPTASSQRLVTTCNGGSGTDWDVPQNWTGTYGGDPSTYASDVKKQVLIGEYGAWRTIDLHTEGPFVQNGTLSEDRMTQLMEQKVRLAESVKDSSAGHFFWLLTSHDNPGRVQGGEGLREIDRLGPVNYKGLLTPWEEPLDVFYMYRSNYVSKKTSPMLYIVSHTWANRWTSSGKKDGIIVYSNCDEVELFNDVNNISLGKRKREGIGTHFRWDNVDVQYNVLYAIGYVDGKPVAKDIIVLDHLPVSPGFDKLYVTAKPVTKPAPGYNYIYRINCGGPEYKDENGNVWQSDSPLPTPASPTVIRQWQRPMDSRLPTPDSRLGSASWTNDFPGMPAFFSSQRRTSDPINGTKDWQLFQDFRYGKDKLKYEFPLPDGEYKVEFYFIEPWLGIGGGIDARSMRLFDIAVNGKTVLQNIDIWKEAGTNNALKKTITAKITGGRMVISFPQSRSGQAIISAIAIASLNKQVKPAMAYSLITGVSNEKAKRMTWLDAGNKQYSDASIAFRSLPANLYGAEWLQFSKNDPVMPTSFTVTQDADVFVGMDQSLNALPAWIKEYENMQTIIETDEDGEKKYKVYRLRVSKRSTIRLGKLPAAAMYPVIVVPVTTMQPAYDLKPVNSYRTNVAIVSEGVQKEMFAGRECAVIKSPATVNIQWPVQTGVADIYAITVKYFYPSEKTVEGKIQLIGAGNTMMLEELVSFTFTRSGKWNQFTFNTGTMINAGNYTVKLIITGAEGLAVSGIEVQ
jgi:hypothetical protein